MLDDEEFEIVRQLYARVFSPEYRRENNFPRQSISERFRPVREKYEEMTGMKDCHENAIMHHQISIYGDPCVRCGKPLRTPQAAFCAACGHKK